MKERIHLYVSRKNALTWLMTLCLVGSAVARIALPGLKGSGDALNVWSQIVLPTAATLLYVLIVLLNGKEMFYKTAIPVWLMGLYYAMLPHTVLGDHPFVLGMYYTCIVFYCLAYTAITCGKIRYPWLLVPLFMSAIAAVGFTYRDQLTQGVVPIQALPDALLFLGCLLLCFGIRVHSDGRYHPTWGDRNDGRKIRTLAPMAQIPAYFQVERNTCSNLFEESFEITHIAR